MTITTTVVSDHIYSRMLAGLEKNIKIRTGDNGSAFDNFDNVIHVNGETGFTCVYMNDDFVEYSGIMNVTVPIHIDEIGFFRNDVLVTYTHVDQKVKLNPGKHVIMLRAPRNSKFSGGFMITI